ncbi:hypothetical protein NQ317_017689 [Molorchus minor]|uniref:Uncharacterized protein n=1 Tax=Molorchus minor TaxID=1323400 RepID=A0ABQ9JNT3_9CUCU|nr:hypothetical protein NQ317_017689 [Molorchus minor]
MATSMESLAKDLYDAELKNELNSLNKTLICGICGENHTPKECYILKVTNQIADKEVPSKARLTLPDSLEIRKLADCTYSIYVRQSIKRSTRFGPFQARKLFNLLPMIELPLKIFTDGENEDLSEYFLDTSDENECNWMIFVRPASDFDEQNVICYQEGGHLYYGTMRDIEPGEPLKVWYSPYYAVQMKKQTLRPNDQENFTNMNHVVTDVETILKKKKNITPRDSWSCKFCGKVEKELSAFALHLLDHYRAQINRVCTICKDSFLTREKLKKHLKFVHGSPPTVSVEKIKDTKIPISKAKDPNESKESVGGPLLLNDIIPDSLDNSNLFLAQSAQTDINHFDLNSMENQNILLENENLNLNVENILITDNVKELGHFNFDIKEQETDRLVCDICLKSFAKLRSLIQHIELHTGKFLCHQCNKVFGRKESLTHHSCNSFYKIKCPFCERIFFQKKVSHLSHKKSSTISKSKLNAHNCPSIPLDRKEIFTCKTCNKSFLNKVYLDRHILRHKKVKNVQQYVCAVCNMILNSKSSCLKHVKLHEGHLYSCDMCDKIFRRTDSLMVHKQKVHWGEGEMATCDICKQTVKSKKLLKIHMEIHRRDKPHVCSVCQAAFRQRSNLTKHANKHKPERARSDWFQEKVQIYRCPRCDKNMKLKSSLSRHMRRFHPADELSFENMKPRLGRLSKKKILEEHEIKRGDIESDDDESVMDLKQTIENMDFNTDDVRCDNNDINIDIDKILCNTDDIDNFLNESSDRIVESLINIATKNDQLTSVCNQSTSKEVCLSMPDLSENDQELKLDLPTRLDWMNEIFDLIGFI